jgi:hypothetical protein
MYYRHVYILCKRINNYIASTHAEYADPTLIDAAADRIVAGETGLDPPSSIGISSVAKIKINKSGRRSSSCGDGSSSLDICVPIHVCMYVCSMSVCKNKWITSEGVLCGQFVLGVHTSVVNGLEMQKRRYLAIYIQQYTCTTYVCMHVCMYVCTHICRCTYPLIHNSNQRGFLLLVGSEIGLIFLARAGRYL